jgi:hypothetical protein
MLKFLSPLLLAACTAFAGAAHAQTLVLEPVIKPLDPALERTELDGKSKFEVRALSLVGANALLDSTEGPAWQVLAVQAGACENPKAKEKFARKNCQALKAECKKAGEFAREHDKYVVCSALYTQTTVLLTNDASPNKRAKVAKAAPKKVAKPIRKPQRKAAPAVRKPAATSC